MFQSEGQYYDQQKERYNSYRNGPSQGRYRDQNNDQPRERRERYNNYATRPGLTDIS